MCICTLWCKLTLLLMHPLQLPIKLVVLEWQTNPFFLGHFSLSFPLCGNILFLLLLWHKGATKSSFVPRSRRRSSYDIVCTYAFHKLVSELMLLNLTQYHEGILNILPCNLKTPYAIIIFSGLAVSDLASLITMCWTCKSFTFIAVLCRFTIWDLGCNLFGIWNATFCMHPCQQL